LKTGPKCYRKTRYQSQRIIQIEVLKKQIERLKLRKEKLLDTLLDVVITNETFKERNKLVEKVFRIRRRAIGLC
jgi:hypothetical protein